MFCDLYLLNHASVLARCYWFWWCCLAVCRVIFKILTGVQSDESLTHACVLCVQASYHWSTLSCWRVFWCLFWASSCLLASTMWVATFVCLSVGSCNWVNDATPTVCVWHYTFPVKYQLTDDSAEEDLADCLSHITGCTMSWLKNCMVTYHQCKVNKSSQIYSKQWIWELSAV